MRTKLARTLLVLGIGLPACERADSVAQPLADSLARPAVGNIGQTGRPAAVAVPLATPLEEPAVGNIGQTGRPQSNHDELAWKRRQERVARAAKPRVEQRQAPPPMPDPPRPVLHAPSRPIQLDV